MKLMTKKSAMTTVAETLATYVISLLIYEKNSAT